MSKLTIGTVFNQFSNNVTSSFVFGEQHGISFLSLLGFCLSLVAVLVVMQAQSTKVKFLWLKSCNYYTVLPRKHPIVGKSSGLGSKVYNYTVKGFTG